MAMGKHEVVVADTGRCNVASVLAALGRAGAEPSVSDSPEIIAAAEFAVLPGVGSFGPVALRLAESGLGRAFSARVARGAPTLGICLGMQLFFNASEESPGAMGISALSGNLTGFDAGVRSPQFGWNRVSAGGSAVSEDGWAYFANSYKLDAAPDGWHASTARYGSDFVAALEKGPVLLCQFHPELSGEWGLRLIRRWLRPDFCLRKNDTFRTQQQTFSLPVSLGRKNNASSAIRVIPCLDISAGRVVKGLRFKDMRDVGEPAFLAERYEREGADELVLLDIGAGKEGRGPSLETIQSVRAAIGIPLCAGGGVSSLKDAENMLKSGADKVSINSMAYRKPGLVTEIAREFGRQCCVVAVDAARDADGTARVFLDSGRFATGACALDWARRAVDLGAGEILLTSRDRDGTGLGYDAGLISDLSRALPGTPVIASGGAASADQVYDGVRSGAAAVLLAGALHDKKITIACIKSYMRNNGAEVRIC